MEQVLQGSGHGVRTDPNPWPLRPETAPKDQRLGLDGLPALFAWARRLWALCHPSSSLLPLLPFKVGIQVTSEDLCSENQWTVCKALATFVAHQQLSKVASCCHPQRCLWWAQSGVPWCLRKGGPLHPSQDPFFPPSPLQHRWGQASVRLLDPQQVLLSGSFARGGLWGTGE